MPVQFVAEEEYPAPEPVAIHPTFADEVRKQVAEEAAGVASALAADNERWRKQLIGEIQEALARPVAVEPTPREPVDEAMMGVLTAISQALATRFMLAASVIMAFVLACWAMAAPGILPVVILVLFSVLTIGPLTWLLVRGKG